LTKLSRISFSIVFVLFMAASLSGQDLGPRFRQIKEGIYVQLGNNGSSNSGIILTQEGVVVIDSGRTPADSREMMAAIKKLTSQPIRFLINTEIHDDHTSGNFVFSPPGIVINSQGAGAAMRAAFNPKEIEDLRAQSPAMREAVEGFRLVTPQIEYGEKMTLHLGERTLEILHLKNAHSGADSAIWLPRERVLFASSAMGTRRLNTIRTPATVPDIVNAIKMMNALNPELVIPGHGMPGTSQLFEETERYYGLLTDGVGKMIRDGKSLDQIKQDLRIPEFAHWENYDRLPNNIEAAYRAARGTNN
jgi:cyclase